MPSPVHIGFGVQDYTPVEPPDGAFKVFDPISYRALILREGDKNVTFLAGDCFSIESDVLVKSKDRLSDISWLDLDHILPCAAHVGTTPILFQSYVSIPCEALKYYGQEENFADQIAGAIRRAAATMTPGRVGIGLHSAPGILFNRRSFDADGELVMSNFQFPYPRPELTYAKVDEHVYVLRVDDEEGYPTHCAFVFGCHALCSTDKYGHISADYPGVARRVLEAAGIKSLFLPGSIGNVVPVSRAGRTFERVGNSVAGAALYALEQTATLCAPSLQVRQNILRVPTFRYSDPKGVESELVTTPSRSDGLQRFQAYGSRLQEQGRSEIDYTITRVSLGEAEIVHLPGEIFAETAGAIKAAAGERLTVVLSGPTADVGYLSTPQAHREGGMEPRFAGLAIEGEPMIRAAACDLLQS